MGTHPIFESDFDCLTDTFRILLVVYLNQLYKAALHLIKMVKGDRQAWKAAYFEKASKLLNQYERIFICDADNVSSKQFQDIRTGMRGHGDILMGKNTMMKKVIKDCAASNPALEKLLPLVRQNVGFVMTNGDLKEVRDLIQSYKVPASARSGAISPIDVSVPAQATTLGPEKTSFFQALSIPTKITRGLIGITAKVDLLTAGDKVGQSEATLLTMLNIRPFEYGFDILHVYDSGSVFAPCILDITEEDIRSRFCAGVANLALSPCQLVIQPLPPCPTPSPTVSRTSWPLPPPPKSSSPRSSSSRLTWPIHLPSPLPPQLRKPPLRRLPPPHQSRNRRSPMMTWALTCSVKSNRSMTFPK